MNQLPETDLFEIKLSKPGAGWLLRLHGLIRLYFIFSIVLSIFLLISCIFRFRINNHYNIGEDGDWLSFTEGKIVPIYLTVSTVLTIIQIYFYYYFSRL